jgi:NlpE N-terminal domain/NlpE C-terminal OB domain
VLVWTALAAGCGGGNADTSGQTVAMPEGLPGVYAGDWPCGNCRSIEATLWLRPDFRFFLRQTFVGGDDAGVDRSYSIGTWRWDERAGDITAASVGPDRRFVPLPGGRLELHTFSRVPYGLTKVDAGAPFRDVVRMDGESALVDGGATFKECLSGLKLAIVPERGFKELRRQHRILNARGKPALTTIEGHLSEAGKREQRREALVVDRVITLKPGAHCRDGS